MELDQNRVYKVALGIVKDIYRRGYLHWDVFYRCHKLIKYLKEHDKNNNYE